MESGLSYWALALSLAYLVMAFFSGAVFFTGRRAFSVVVDAALVIVPPAHLLYLVAVAVVERKVPLTSFFEALSAIAFLLALGTALLYFAVRVKSAPLFALPLVFLFQVISAVGTQVVYLPEQLFRSPLFGAHTLLTLLGYAAFGCSMVAGLMYLHLFRQLKRHRLRRMYDRLPPLELLERVNEAALVSGFVFLTAGILLGGILAQRVWGTIPLEDPKILLSGVLWLIYVFALVMRRGFRWSGRRFNTLGVLGFGALVVIMAVVRLLVPTMHRF